MKSKKLFAILTLVAFMMTLVPMAAFAVGIPYSTTNSTLAATGTSVDDVYDATVAKAAKFTLTFKNNDADKTPVTGAPVDFYIQTSNDLAVGWVEGDATPGTADTYNAAQDFELDGNSMDSADGQLVNAVTPDANGKVVFYLGAYSATKFTVSVFDAEGAADGDQIGSDKTVSVEVAAGDIVVEAFEDDDDTTAQTTFIAGEGLEVRADLGTGEEDVEVTFKQQLNGGSWTTLGVADTDSDGVAAFYVEAEKSGTYVFRAVAGSKDGDSADITVSAGEPDQIEFKTAAGKIALDKAKSIEIYVKDAAGNLYKNTTPDVVSYEFTAAPAGSEYEDAEGTLKVNNRGIATIVGSTSFTPDELGTYTIKAKLESDTVDVGNDSATITFECVSLGTVTSLAFDVVNGAGDAVPSIRYIEDDAIDGLDGVAITDPGTVEESYAKIRPIWVNADGVKVYVPAATVLTDIEFASSDAGVVTVSPQGYLTVIDDDFIGTVTITATYGEDNVVGTYDVKVAGKPNSFTATPVVDGKTATVTVQLVDKAGNPTTSYTGDFVVKETLQVIAPAGVVVSGKANLDQKGQGSFTLTADAVGKQNITVTATVDGNSTGVAKTFPVEFVAAAAEKPAFGAKTVTMFIGAPGYTQDGTAKVSDVAPFIKDGRTFVAVRPVADAFGAQIGWNEATQTVTLTRSDVTVTIVIGSNAVTVVKGGVTSTVTADVAAFIKDGRTVLPFRAVGEAFGATVNYDAATQAVTYQQ